MALLLAIFLTSFVDNDVGQWGSLFFVDIIMPCLVPRLFSLLAALEAVAAHAAAGGFEYVRPLIGTVNGGE